MGRPKLPKLEKKVNLGITISRDVNNKLDAITNNKSKLIEELIVEHLKNLK